jgi:hypothetical protein
MTTHMKKKTSVKMPWKSLSLAVKVNVVRYTGAHKTSPMFA